MGFPSCARTLLERPESGNVFLVHRGASFSAPQHCQELFFLGPVFLRAHPLPAGRSGASEAPDPEAKYKKPVSFIAFQALPLGPGGRD